MNPKVYVGAAVGALAVIIGILTMAGPALFDDISNEGFLSPQTGIQGEILPLEIELEKISILEVSEKFATVEVTFKATNPNPKSIILQFLKYQLYESDQRIHIGEIGERIQGMVGGSNYFTVLSQNSISLSDEITIRNTGNTPELWSALTNDSANWKIEGEAIFNLSSMTSGGENEILFEFP